MKKSHMMIATVVLSTLLLGIGAASAATDTPPAGAKQIQHVRDLLGGLPQFPKGAEQATYIQQDRFGNPAWDVYFYRTEEGKPEQVHAEFDAATGDLVMLSYENPAWAGEERSSDEQARITAEDFLKKAAPHLAKRVSFARVTPLRSVADVTWAYASVRFEEQVGGIPFPQNYADVNVDQFGHVIGLNAVLRFDSSKLPPAFVRIPEADAQKAFAKALTLEKSYTTRIYQSGIDGQYAWNDRVSLGYRASGGVPAIDALTGNVLPDYFWTPMQSAMPVQKLQLKGQGESLKAGSEQMFRCLISELMHTDLSKLEPGTLPDQKDGDHVLHTSYWNGDVTVNAVQDATTGEIRSISKLDPSLMKQKPALTVEQGYEKAQTLLQRYLPAGENDLFLTRVLDQTKRDLPPWFDYTTTQPIQPENIYLYVFNIGHQGAPIEDRAFRIRISAVTGEAVGLDVQQFTAPAGHLPDNMQTLTEAAAKEVFLKANPLQLVYYWPEFAGQPAPHGTMLYQVDPQYGYNSYVDAVTGEWTSLKR